MDSLSTNQRRGHNFLGHNPEVSDSWFIYRLGIPNKSSAIHRLWGFSWFIYRLGIPNKSPAIHRLWVFSMSHRQREAAPSTHNRYRCTCKTSDEDSCTRHPIACKRLWCVFQNACDYSANLNTFLNKLDHYYDDRLRRKT